VKLDINSVEVHPQLNNNGHPVDGVLVGVGSLCPMARMNQHPPMHQCRWMVQ